MGVSISCRTIALCSSFREPTVASQKTFAATSLAIFARKELTIVPSIEVDWSTNLPSSRDMEYSTLAWWFPRPEGFRWFSRRYRIPERSESLCWDYKSSRYEPWPRLSQRPTFSLCLSVHRRSSWWIDVEWRRWGYPHLSPLHSDPKWPRHSPATCDRADIWRSRVLYWSPRSGFFHHRVFLLCTTSRSSLRIRSRAVGLSPRRVQPCRSSNERANLTNRSRMTNSHGTSPVTRSD